MSERWCGCVNYESCNMCRDNFEGDAEKEQMRILGEAERTVAKHKREIRNELEIMRNLLEAYRICDANEKTCYVEYSVVTREEKFRLLK